MRILGADLPRRAPVRGGARTLVALAADGRVNEIRHLVTAGDLIAEVVRIAGDEPFALAVPLPVAVGPRAAKARPFESVVRRRLGVRLDPGGRAAVQADRDAPSGDTLLAALAAAGRPCLPYPDRDRRVSGLAEVHPALALKALLWHGSAVGESRPHEERAALFQAFPVPEYRAGRGRASWQERAAALDLVQRALGKGEPFDFGPSREALAAAGAEAEVELAGSLFDAALAAGTVLHYLDSPESCVFVGERDSGYTILPADGFLRQLVLRDGPREDTRLFPQASVLERLGAIARLRELDLLDVRGRGRRVDAELHEPPLYEFDNVDEMLWWKHCRHLRGPALPTEGLEELVVTLGVADDGKPLRLERSRHRTLSFRFVPPASWRTHLATRDGKTYALRVRHAVYDVA